MSHFCSLHFCSSLSRSPLTLWHPILTPTIVAIVVPMMILSASSVAAVPLGPAQAPAVAVAPPSSVIYTPPVDAPIVDSFRPPESFAGPGNRGIEYGVTAGMTVHAAGDGVVAFAGQVGGELYITISHADGVDTTYSYLAEISVSAGQSVSRGQVIGTTSGIFHFGAKVGDAYLDPESLFGASGPDGAAAVLGSDPVSAGTAILLPTDG